MKCSAIVLLSMVAFFSESVNSQFPLPLNPLKAVSQLNPLNAVPQLNPLNVVSKLNPLNVIPELNPLKIVENVQDMAEIGLNGNIMGVMIKYITNTMVQVTGMSLSELRDFFLNGATQVCGTIENFLENMGNNSENEILHSVIVIQKRICSSIIGTLENINGGEREKK